MSAGLWVGLMAACALTPGCRRAHGDLYYGGRADSTRCQSRSRP